MLRRRRTCLPGSQSWAAHGPGPLKMDESIFFLFFPPVNSRSLTEVNYVNSPSPEGYKPL